jgi:hypothetical protein
MKYFKPGIVLFALPFWCAAQSPLFIPQLLQGTTFNLNVQTTAALRKVTEVEFEMMDNKIVLQTDLLPAGFYKVLVNETNSGHFLKE